jgi:hypothetical protein
VLPFEFVFFDPGNSPKRWTASTISTMISIVTSSAKCIAPIIIYRLRDYNFASTPIGNDYFVGVSGLILLAPDEENSGDGGQDEKPNLCFPPRLRRNTMRTLMQKGSTAPIIFIRIAKYSYLYIHPHAEITILVLVLLYFDGRSAAGAAL